MATLSLTILATALIVGCGRTPEPDGSRTPAPASPSTGLPTTLQLALGETGVLGAFEFTPIGLDSRPGPVFDEQGRRMDGEAALVTIGVQRLRDPDTGSGSGAESAVPVAQLVDARGEAVEQDHLLGLPPAQAQSDEFTDRYVQSYQYACVQPVGTVMKAQLWFSLPAGFTPESLVIDAGAGQLASWRLD